jgi:hypothetical protein
VAGATLVAVLALGVYLYDNSRRDLIAPGVKVAGVSVGGLHSGPARARLRSAVDTTHRSWITLRHGARRFTLTGSQVRLNADVAASINAAIHASRSGSIVSRTVRNLFGDRLNKNIPLRVSYSRVAVRTLLARVRAAIDRPPRDASVSVSDGGQLVKHASHTGIAVQTGRLARELTQALADPVSAHVLRVPTRIVRPKVTTTMLAARYPAYVIIDRPAFRLRFYRHLRLVHTYPIAVGMQGLQTPPGLHHILDKEINPAWHVPDSPWAGSLAGQVIPPGPEDPWSRGGWRSTIRATASTAPTSPGRSARLPRTGASGCSSQT